MLRNEVRVAWFFFAPSSGDDEGRLLPWFGKEGERILATGRFMLAQLSW